MRTDDITVHSHWSIRDRCRLRLVRAALGGFILLLLLCALPAYHWVHSTFTAHLLVQRAVRDAASPRCRMPMAAQRRTRDARAARAAPPTRSSQTGRDHTVTDVQVHVWDGHARRSDE